MSSFTEIHAEHDVRTMYDTSTRGANVTYRFCRDCDASENTDSRHFTVEQLSATAEDWGRGWARAIVDLDETMTAENPASTRDDMIAGPATVTYVFAPSGSVSVRVDRH